MSLAWCLHCSAVTAKCSDKNYIYNITKVTPIIGAHWPERSSCTAQLLQYLLSFSYFQKQKDSLDGASQSCVSVGGGGVLSSVLRRVCCWWWADVAEYQLLDDIRVERSIDCLVVVHQGDKLCSQQCQFRLDGGQASWYLFKFSLGFGITDECHEVLMHTILCTQREQEKIAGQKNAKQTSMSQ